jgi:Nucleotidyl transferase AbiEii toxin, Type IV TA system
VSTDLQPGQDAAPDIALDRLEPVHLRIATVALRAAARYGFALGGSNALLAHGITRRPAVDVNLLTDRTDAVRAAAGPVQEALRADGFTLQPDGQGRDLAGWTVTGHGGRHRELRLDRAARSHDPVPTQAGPVVHLEDVAGGKVALLACRGQVRDYTDTAALLDRWTPAELASLARRLDRTVGPGHLAEIARRLDRLPDHAFAPYGLDLPWIPDTRAAQVRERFAAWPRDPRALHRPRNRAARTPASQRRAPPERARDDTPDRGR